MNDFHYNYIKKNSDTESLLTDKDRLTFEIKSNEFFMNNFLSGKIYLTLVIIQKVQSFLMGLIKKLLVKWKMHLVELL